MAADNDASDGGGVVVGETWHEKISRPETAATNFDGGMHYSSPSPNELYETANE